MSEQRLPLALRYRPRKLSELVGQRHVAAVLASSLAAGTLPQQLLLSGGSGLGKTTTARICAAAMLCSTPLDERDNADPCGHCQECIDVLTPGRGHPDVVELDAASHGGKDEIKDIAKSAVLAPMRASKKIYIIDEAHGLSAPGGQAFLKLLEEPPAHVVFILCTTEPHKLAKANRGRCSELEMLRPTTEELTSNLLRVGAAEGWALSEDVARAVVSASRPELGVRGTLMVLEKLSGPLSTGQELPLPDALRLLGLVPGADVDRLFAAVLASDRPAAFSALDALRAGSTDELVRAALTTWARDALRGGHGPTASSSAARWLVALGSAGAGEIWTDLVVAQMIVPAPGPVHGQPPEHDATESDRIGALSRKYDQLSRQVEAQQAVLAAAVPPATSARRAHDSDDGPGQAPGGRHPLAYGRTSRGATAQRPSVPADRGRDLGAHDVANSSPAAPAVQRGPRAGAPQPGRPPAPAPGPSGVELGAILDGLEPVSKRAAAVLRGCRPEISPTALTVHVPAGLRDLYHAHEQLIRDAAVAAGLNLIDTVG